MPAPYDEYHERDRSIPSRSNSPERQVDPNVDHQPLLSDSTQNLESVEQFIVDVDHEQSSHSNKSGANRGFILCLLFFLVASAGLGMYVLFGDHPYVHHSTAHDKSDHVTNVISRNNNIHSPRAPKFSNHSQLSQNLSSKNSSIQSNKEASTQPNLSSSLHNLTRSNNQSINSGPVNPKALLKVIDPLIHQGRRTDKSPLSDRSNKESDDSPIKSDSPSKQSNKISVPIKQSNNKPSKQLIKKSDDQSISQSNHPSEILSESHSLLAYGASLFPSDSVELADHCWETKHPFNISFYQSHEQSMIKLLVESLGQTVRLSDSQSFSLVRSAAEKMFQEYRVMFDSIDHMIARLLDQSYDLIVLRARLHSLVRAHYRILLAITRNPLISLPGTQFMDQTNNQPALTITQLIDRHHFTSFDEQYQQSGIAPVITLERATKSAAMKLFVHQGENVQLIIDQLSTEQSINQPIKWNRDRPLLVYAVLTYQREPSNARICVGGFPMVAHFVVRPNQPSIDPATGRSMYQSIRTRPLIQDFYHGVFQIIIDNQSINQVLDLSITGHANLTIRFGDQQLTVSIDLTDTSTDEPSHMIDINEFEELVDGLTDSEKPVDSGLIDETHLPINEASIELDDSVQCDMRHFSSINDEWIGSWVQLAEPSPNPINESSIDLATNHSVYDSIDKSTWCDDYLCSGEFPSLDTTPFSWSQPYMYTRRSCHFHMFSIAESWECMNGQWLVLLGDSNLQDYLRNLISLPLGDRLYYREKPGRDADMIVSSPDRSMQMRITLVWVGGLDLGNNMGMFTFYFPEYLAEFEQWFDGETHAMKGFQPVPDSVLFVQGLHDNPSAVFLDGRGGWFTDVDSDLLVKTINPVPNVPFSIGDRIAGSAEESEYIKVGPPINSYRQQVRQVLDLMHRLKHPDYTTRYIWRTTVATAGYYGTPTFIMSNIHTIREFNKVVVSEMEYHKQRHANPINWLLNDQFDVTHGWNEEPLGLFSDTAHYGRRTPGVGCVNDSCTANPFVEVMQTHISLNILCAK